MTTGSTWACCPEEFTYATPHCTSTIGIGPDRPLVTAIQAAADLSRTRAYTGYGPIVETTTTHVSAGPASTVVEYDVAQATPMQIIQPPEAMDPRTIVGIVMLSLWALLVFGALIRICVAGRRERRVMRDEEQQAQREREGVDLRVKTPLPGYEAKGMSAPIPPQEAHVHMAIQTPKYEA